MSDSEPREAYLAANTQEAYLVKSALEAAGIEAEVVGDQLQNAVGELSASDISPQVVVRGDQYDQARQIIAEHEARKQSTSPATAWVCENCGETNEPSFDICWKCQTDRDDSP